MNIGTQISKARSVAGLSIRSLAKLVRCSAPHLSRVESGQVAPSRALALRIARKLNLCEDDVVIAIGQIPADVHRWLLRNPKEISVVRVRMISARGE